MKKAFVAISESYGTVSRFINGIGDRDFFLSYAQQFPKLDEYDVTSFWMAGGYAAKLHRVGLASHLTAPGQSWLSTVDESLTGRQIITGTVSEMPENTQLWAKPAEAKIDSIIAGRYTKDEILEICSKSNVSENQLFQWTDSILKINHEHRFFVANGMIMTGSPYLIDGIIYSSTMVSPYYDDALRAAVRTVRKLGDNQPPAYTLDMGLNETTGHWIIVESNPAWSSGPYGCDPSLVIDTLEIACNNVGSDWLWEPADNLKQFALSVDPIVETDVDGASGVFLYQK